MGRGPGRGTLRHEGAVWVGAFTDERGRRRRLKLAARKIDAARILTKIIRDRDFAAHGMTADLGLDLTLAEVSALYLADLETRARPRTIHDTKASLARLVSGVGLRRVRDISKAEFARWQQKRVREGTANKTVNTEIGALRAALEHCRQIGKLAINPLDGLKPLPISPRHLKRRRRAFTDEEIERILGFAAEAEADRRRKTFPRAPLLRALACTGARWGELTSTTWADLDVGPQLLTLRAENTKTEAERIVPLDPDTFLAVMGLREHFARIHGREAQAGDRIFLSPRGSPWPRNTGNALRFFHDMLVHAGIQRRDSNGRVVDLHAFRHTFATRLARAGVPIHTARELTGHKTSRMLLDVYTHGDLAQSREAIARLPRLLPATPKRSHA